MKVLEDIEHRLAKQMEPLKPKYESSMNTCEFCGTSTTTVVMRYGSLVCSLCSTAETPKYIKDITTFDKFVKAYNPTHPNFNKALNHLIDNQISLAQTCFSNTQNTKSKITIDFLKTLFYLNEPIKLNRFLREANEKGLSKFKLKDYYSITFEDQSTFTYDEFDTLYLQRSTKITKINLNFCPFCKSSREDVETTNSLASPWPKCKSCK